MLLCMLAAGNLSLIRNRSFVLLALVYAVNMAIVITWQTLIDEFLDTVGFSISKVVSMKTHRDNCHSSVPRLCCSVVAIQLFKFTRLPNSAWLEIPRDGREPSARRSTSQEWSAVLPLRCKVYYTGSVAQLSFEPE